MAGVPRQAGSTPGASQVAQDYLKAMWAHEESGAQGLSVNDLAARMGVVASTASENVARLASQGLVTHQPYRKVHFTPLGRALAVAMIRRHRLLETYLYERLGFDWDEVHEEAEILEHAVSDRLLAHIDAALGHPHRDPHGDPIPDVDGAVPTLQLAPFLSAAPGKLLRIERLSDEDSQVLRDLHAAGIVLDARVRIQANNGDAVTLSIEGAGQVCLEAALLQRVQVSVL